LSHWNNNLFYPSHLLACRMLAVRKLVGGPLTEMEAAARQLELSLQRSAVNAVLRHSNGESATATTDVSVHFVQSGSVNRTVRKLADDGFPNGPPVGPEMLLTEGQRLIVRFRGNVCAADGRTVGGAGVGKSVGTLNMSLCVGRPLG
jgi:hypothetical protein